MDEKLDALTQAEIDASEAQLKLDNWSRQYRDHPKRYTNLFGIDIEATKWGAVVSRLATRQMSYPERVYESHNEKYQELRNVYLANQDILRRALALLAETQAKPLSEIENRLDDLIRKSADELKAVGENLEEDVCRTKEKLRRIITSNVDLALSDTPAGSYYPSWHWDNSTVPHSAGVYLLVDSNSGLIEYVGQSKDIKVRLYGHHVYNRTQVIGVLDENKIEMSRHQVERVLIRHLMPCRNIRGLADQRRESK